VLSFFHFLLRYCIANIQNRVNCVHSSWFPMKTDLASSAAACDYKVVRANDGSLELKGAANYEKHPLAQVSPNGDTYYVCESCQSLRCSNCHETATK